MDTEMREIKIPAATSIHRGKGTYSTSEYFILTSNYLTFERIVPGKEKNYYSLKRKLSDGERISTASEELAMQLGLERAGQDPRKSSEFKNLFSISFNHSKNWQFTETGLRVPKGRDPEKYETDGQGRKYRPRIVLIGDQEVGEVLVPSEEPIRGDSVVVEWDEVFGIPRVIANEKGGQRSEKYTTVFHFDHNPEKDPISGRLDVGVIRRNKWNEEEIGKQSINIDARYPRSVSSFSYLYRPVQGPLPEIHLE